MKKNKNREALLKSFPVAYIENGLNGTKAYKSVKGQHIKSTSAGTEANKLLKIPEVQKAIVALLPREDEDTSVIKEAYNATRSQDISWKDLRGFTELSLRLKGHLNNNTDKPSVQVGIIIERT